jgi:hypothetical protein
MGLEITTNRHQKYKQRIELDGRNSLNWITTITVEQHNGTFRVFLLTLKDNLIEVLPVRRERIILVSLHIAKMD